MVRKQVNNYSDQAPEFKCYLAMLILSVHALAVSKNVYWESIGQLLMRKMH